MKLFFSSHISKLGGPITLCVLSITTSGMPAVADPNTTYRDRSSLAQAQPLPALAEARRRARNLRENYPGWKDALDECPCTRREAEANPRFIDKTHYYTEDYHPGAMWEYRTPEDAVGTYTSPTLSAGSPVLRPGQQCAYGADGQLITHGSGAGTPDAYAPSVTYWGQGVVSNNSHTFWDVEPFDAGMNWQEYHRTWTPNNSNTCSANFVAVFKTNRFVDTGISVKPGERIKIRASGTVRFGPFAGFGSANGIVLNPNYNYFVNVQHGRLMARFRQPGMQALDGWSPIGEGWDQVREVKLLSPGILEFLVNDNQPGDNRGKFRIEVTIHSGKQ